LRNGRAYYYGNNEKLNTCNIKKNKVTLIPFPI
jgi:hypothetical protein